MIRFKHEQKTQKEMESFIMSPRDPGSPSENGFMEPKWPMLFGGDWTPQSLSGNMTSAA